MIPLAVIVVVAPKSDEIGFHLQEERAAVVATNSDSKKEIGFSSAGGAAAVATTSDSKKETKKMPTLEEMEIEEQENAAGEESDEDSSDDEENFIVSGAVPRALQIQQLKTQLRNLEKEHKNHVREARMLLDAQERYKRWDNGTPRWGIQADRKPANVLLALKSAKVPLCMKWSYPYTFYNYTLEHNRDVLLARLELDDFESTFADKAYDVPKRFRKDKEVMMVICSKNSQALQFASKNLQVIPCSVHCCVRSPCSEA